MAEGATSVPSVPSPAGTGGKLGPASASSDSPCQLSAGPSSLHQRPPVLPSHLLSCSLSCSESLPLRALTSVIFHLFAPLEDPWHSPLTNSSSPSCLGSPVPLLSSASPASGLHSPVPQPHRPSFEPLRTLLSSPINEHKKPLCPATPVSGDDDISGVTFKTGRQTDVRCQKETRPPSSACECCNPPPPTWCCRKHLPGKSTGQPAVAHMCGASYCL